MVPTGLILLGAFTLISGWYATRIHRGPRPSSEQIRRRPPEPHARPADSSGRQVQRWERPNELLRSINEEHTKAAREVETLKEKREETVKLVKGAEKLGRNLRNLNILRLVGSSAGFAGAFVSCLGIALVLFTVITTDETATLAGIVGGGVAGAAGTAVAYIAGCFRSRWENQYRTKLRETVEEDRRQCVKVGILFNCFEEYYVCVVKSGNLPQGLVTSYEAQIRAAFLQKRMEVCAITDAVNDIINNLNAPEERRNEKSTIELILSSGAWVNTAITVWKNFGSFATENIDLVVAVAAFQLLATIGVGTLFVLISTSLSFNSNFAEEICKNFSQFSVEEERLCRLLARVDLCEPHTF